MSATPTTLEASPPRPTGGARRATRGRGRVAVAAALGLGTTVAVAAVRIVAPVHGPAAVVGAALLVLALPTSRILSRRILLGGSFVLGLTPLLWWVRLPLGSLGRAGLLLALLVGGVAAWLVVGGRDDVPRRARALLPRIAAVDAVPVLAAAASAAVVSSWFRARTGPAALAALLPGWDNSAHFDMVEMLLRHGVTVDRLGAAPLGETWQFADYPQGYHAVVATLIEAMGVPPLTDPGAALVGYLHAEAWIVVLLGGLLAAAVCSVPMLRRRPAVALPAAALLVAGFVTGPGASAFAGGFPNFVFAAALAACLPLLVASMPRVAMPLHVAAMGALLVGVADSWILLLVVAAPAAAVLAFPATRVRWHASRRRWWQTGFVLGIAALAVLVPVRVLSSLSPGATLVIPGGIQDADPALAIAVAFAAIALCLLSTARASRAWLALVPSAGLAAAAALGAWQLHSAGSLSYYFYKLLIGVELVSLAVVVVALSQIRLSAAAPGVSAPRRPFARRAAAVIAATVAAAQLTGITLTGHHEYSAAPAPPAPFASTIDAAAVRVDAPRVTVLLATSPVSQLNAQQWYLALTGGWTVAANDEATRTLLAPGSDQASTVAALLDAHQAAVVLVDPSRRDAVRQSAGTADRAQRVLSW